MVEANLHSSDEVKITPRHSERPTHIESFLAGQRFVNRLSFDGLGFSIRLEIVGIYFTNPTHSAYLFIMIAVWNRVVELVSRPLLAALRLLDVNIITHVVNRILSF